MLLHPVSEIETLETGSPPSQSAAADWEGPKVCLRGFAVGLGRWSKGGRFLARVVGLNPVAPRRILL